MDCPARFGETAPGSRGGPQRITPPPSPAWVSGGAYSTTGRGRRPWPVDQMKRSGRPGAAGLSGLRGRSGKTVPARREDAQRRARRCCAQPGEVRPSRVLRTSGEREMPTMQRAAVPGEPRRRACAHRDQMPPLRRHQHPEAGRARTPSAMSVARRRRVWLYVPPRFLPSPFSGSLSVPALADWSSASMSQNPDIALSVSSSGTRSLRQCSWRGWQTRPWIRHLSGTMSEPSTAALGVAAFISSLPAIPASPSRRRASGTARMIPGTFGPKSPASLARCSPNGPSPRTSKGISIWDLPTSSAAFKAWATASRRACSQRQKSVRPSFGVGCSFWPTLTKSQWSQRVEIEMSQTGLRLLLDDSQIGSQFGIEETTRTWTLAWLMAEAFGVDWSKAPRFRRFRPLHLTLRRGSRSSPGDLIFNPNFSDWMMGWPIGWTDPRQPVTGWSVWLQHMRGLLSNRLSSADTESWASVGVSSLAR